MINRVTITGADDSVQPSDLLALSKKYPFVEWGILFGSRSATNRFPSHEWIDTLIYMYNSHNTIHLDRGRETDNIIQLSAHFCGRYVRESLYGHWPKRTTDLIAPFNRIQLNTHGEKHGYFDSALIKMAAMPKEFIIQADNVNTELILATKKHSVNASVLFDTSHGAGIAPKVWPKPIPRTYCGYAGGLGPDNLEKHIQSILDISKKFDRYNPVWIDMETYVRSDNDKQFDLDKVEQCLKIATPYVKF